MAFQITLVGNLNLIMLIASMISGGLAGMSVDIGLFPIDTLKSRIQHGGKAMSSKNNIYSGLAASAAGSFPSAAAFFLAYDYSSYTLKKKSKI